MPAPKAVRFDVVEYGRLHGCYGVSQLAGSSECGSASGELLFSVQGDGSLLSEQLVSTGAASEAASCFDLDIRGVGQISFITDQTDGELACDLGEPGHFACDLGTQLSTLLLNFWRLIVRA